MIRQFRSLDPEAFGALARHLGFAGAACYRWLDGTLVQVLCWNGAAEAQWPAAVGISSFHHYTPGDGGLPPLGYTRPRDSGTRGEDWPKGAFLYFPEQDLHEEKIVFALSPAAGRRPRPGELSAALEAVAGRVRILFAEQRERAEVAEAGVRDRLMTLGFDMQNLVDHELRTPLASVAGYLELMRDLDPAADGGVWREYSRVVDSELQNALDAIDKLSLALAESGTAWQGDVETFDAAQEARALAAEAQARASDLIGPAAAARLQIRFNRTSDRECRVEAVRRLYRWALWEVMKNAVIHARGGQVEVAVYTTERVLIIDVVDDGEGVSQGAEELVFLRFYQDPKTRHLRRGKKGLGLGLFLARYIAERHTGGLTFVRQKGRSVFRFVWPLAGEEAGGGRGPGGDTERDAG